MCASCEPEMWQAPGAGFRRESWGTPKTVSGLRGQVLGRRPKYPMPKTQHRRSLLQYDLIAFLQPAQHFGLRAVRDSDVDGNFILAFFALRVGNLYGCLLV